MKKEGSEQVIISSPGFNWTEAIERIVENHAIKLILILAYKKKKNESSDS